jgi:hypothetical protein
VLPYYDQGQTLRPWLEPTMIQLQALLRLLQNWDSYNARPVSPNAALRALAVLVQIMPADGPPPSVIPTPSGGVVLEWHPSGQDLEVEITPEQRVIVSLSEAQTSAYWEADLTENLPRLAALLTS